MKIHMVHFTYNDAGERIKEGWFCKHDVSPYEVKNYEATTQTTFECTCKNCLMNLIEHSKKELLKHPGHEYWTRLIGRATIQLSFVRVPARNQRLKAVE